MYDDDGLIESIDRGLVKYERILKALSENSTKSTFVYKISEVELSQAEFLIYNVLLDIKNILEQMKE